MQPAPGISSLLPRLAESVSASRRTGPLLILVFFVSLSFSIFHSNARLVAVVDGAVADELHSLVVGIRHLDPFAGEPVSKVRQGETTRWFVRLLYPVGVFYMNGRMGGEVRTLTGWKYSGGYYLEKHYAYGKDIRKNVPRDPNVQDFVFAMRVAFGLMAAACFCLALWALSRCFGPAAVAVYGGLILGSPLVLNEFRSFYSEVTLFILFNLAVFFCCKRGLSTYRRMAYLGVLAAAALSTKPTGLMIAVPLFACALVFEVREPGREGGGGGRREVAAGRSLPPGPAGGPRGAQRPGRLVLRPRQRHAGQRI